MSCVIFLPLPNLGEVPIRPGGEATGIIYHGLNMQSVLAVVNVFSEQLYKRFVYLIVPNNVWSERTFV